MNFAEIIDLNAVDLNYTAAGKEDVLHHMASMLRRSGAVTSAGDFLEDVYAREAEGITGIGGGIAIPHGKSGAVVKNCVSVCRLAEPVAWESIDEEPITLVILFAATKETTSGDHLRMMAGVAAALADEEVCEGVKHARTVQELLSAFGSARRAALR